MIYKKNTKVFVSTQFFHSLVFTIPIWIAFYQGFLSPIEISTLVGFQYFLQIIMELPSGAFADLLGRKISLSLSFLIGSISFLMFPFATSFIHFLILAALVGISDSFRSGSEEAIMYDSHVEDGKEKEFEGNYGRGHLIYQTGLIVGTITGGVLYSINIFLPYILYGVSLFIGFTFTLFYIEPKIDTEKFSLKNYILQIKKGFKEAFKDKLTTYTSLFYIFVGGITWTNALYFASYFMISLGFDDVERGFIQGGIRLLNVMLITYVIKKINIKDKWRIIFFPVAMIVGFTPGMLVSGWAGLPFFEIALLAGTSRWIFLSSLTNSAFSSKVRATAISVLSLLIGLIYIGIVAVSGPIIQYYSMGHMYTFLGILSLITVAPIAWRLLKIKKLI